nr:dicarboxylate/amino acid:cation symporter [Treponema pallidum]
MKIWLKFFVGSCIGALVAYTIPETLSAPLMQTISELVVSAGSYMLYPVIFFGFSVSIFEMRRERLLLRTTLISIGACVATAFSLSLVGLFSVLVYRPARIPIFATGTPQNPGFQIRTFFLQLFPASSFEVFTNGDYLLPLCIFASFVGAGCAVDRVAAKPVLALFESLTRVAHTVMVFFVDMLSIGFIALSAHWLFRFRPLLSTGVFTDLVILLTLTAIFICSVLYPALIKIMCPEVNPYRVLYAALAPMSTAFFSQNAHATLPVLLYHAEESIGVQRTTATVLLSIFSIFGRAGSACAITMSFALILKSYSHLGIGFFDALWIITAASFLSIFLGRFPTGGVLIALASICAWYGRGFGSGYLVIRPAAFFVGSIATTLDTLNALICTAISAERIGTVRHRAVRFFI